MTTPQDKLEAIREKIQKLLALSSSSNANEAGAALAKARELMIQYSIEESELRGVEVTASQITIVKVGNIVQPRQIWETKLGNEIAKCFNCQLVFNPYQVWFIGTTEEASIAAESFEIVRHRAVEMAFVATQAHTDRVKKQYGLSSIRGVLYGADHPKTFRFAYLAGLVDGVRRQRVESERRDTVEVTALVVVREGAIKEYIQETIGKVEERSLEMSAGNFRAYEQGYTDGRSMDLGTKKRIEG